MPIIKSAKKRVKQSEKAYQKNKHYNSRMRTMVKNVLKATDAEKAEKIIPEAYSAIDTALKKKILHKNNASRKKALIAKKVESLKSGKVEVKPAPAKDKSQKKAVVKTTTTKAKKTTTKKAPAKKKETTK